VLDLERPGRLVHEDIGIESDLARAHIGSNLRGDPPRNVSLLAHLEDLLDGRILETAPMQPKANGKGVA
jgi:hypothetical protein